MDQRVNFHQQLQATKDDVLFVGSMVMKAINGSVEALIKRDLARAHQIIEDDSKINKKRFEIEDKCIELITKQQPDFDSRSYGYTKLSDLMTATTLFELERRSAGDGRQGALFVRDKRRHQPGKKT